MTDLERPELPSLGTSGGRGRGKQVFFLFMSAVVVAVVIFLLGVSVGRGVRKPGAPTDTGVAGDTTVNAAATPARPDAAADAKSHDPAATTGGDPTTSPAPATVSEPVAAPPAAVSDAPPASNKSASPKPSKTPAAGEYSVQVGAYKSLKAAQAVMARVKTKSRDYPVAVVTMPESDPSRFRVFVGPYANRTDAESAASRLKKDGFATLIKH